MLANPSSVKPSQSLSFPSQTSITLGWMEPSLSLQSWLLETYPEGAVQAVTETALLPNPSPSASLKKTEARAVPSSICPLQLLSLPSQVSAAFGLMAASESLQSRLLVTYPA